MTDSILGVPVELPELPAARQHLAEAASALRGAIEQLDDLPAWNTLQVAQDSLGEQLERVRVALFELARIVNRWSGGAA